MSSNQNVESNKEAELTSQEQDLLEKHDSEYRVRHYMGKFALFVSFFAIIWSIFQLYVNSIGILDAIRLRSWHIIFLLIMAFMLYPGFKRERRKRRLPTLWDFICILATIASFGYLLSNYTDIVRRGGYLLPIDYVFGAIGIAVIFEAARRVVGNLAILALIFLLYNFFGSFIPGVLGHGGFSLKRVIDHLFWGSQGILGIGIGVSATYVFLFILFGSFLKHSGFSNFINDLALTLVGRSPGGPAKVSVLASALMGMINGSAIANVASTGTITIPLMKKNGYSARFAAAVEAVASTGGQFTPPIMGAAGFIMAEFLGVPYTTVMLAAIIPAFLYYATLLFAVHFEAKKLGLKGLSKENIPAAMKVMKEQGHLIIPLIVLLGLLFAGYTPLFAAVYSILAVIVASWFRKSTRMGLKKILEALEEGARGSVGVGVACAVIGVIIGTVSLTGLGLSLGYSILSYVNDSLAIAAILVMIISIVLGLGVPGVAAYVIVATVSAPVLVELGAPALAAHMFVLFYACLSNITPPVALASYVAAGIAGADENKVSYTAVKLGLTGFIMPFFFIFNPVLLYDGGVIGPAIVPAITATIGVIALASGLQGWLLRSCNWPTRILLMIIAFCMIEPTFLLDVIGLVLFAAILLWQKVKVKQEGAQLANH